MWVDEEIRYMKQKFTGNMLKISPKIIKKLKKKILQKWGNINWKYFYFYQSRKWNG